MNKAIKYRIYPTREQAVLFAKTFGCCRKVYISCLRKIESYQATGKFVAVTPAKYKKEYPYLKEVDSLALANAQRNLQSAFRSCFSKKRKRKNGFPKFKSAKRVVSPTRQIIKRAPLLLWIANTLSYRKLVR